MRSINEPNEPRTIYQIIYEKAETIMNDMMKSGIESDQKDYEMNFSESWNALKQLETSIECVRQDADDLENTLKIHQVLYCVFFYMFSFLFVA